MRWLALPIAVLLLAGAFAGCAAPDKTIPETRSVPDRRTTTPVPSSAPSSSPTTAAPTTQPSATSSPPPSGTSPPPPPPPPPSPPPPEKPKRQWATPETAKIRPGAALDDGSCTANFVFTSPDESIVYLGTAAHCFGTGLPNETDGCDAGTEGVGGNMRVQGATRPAVVVYSSWVTMQEKGESDDATCRFNDFALLRLDPVDYPLVSPAMSQYGGPTSMVDAQAVQTFDKVLSYGNSGSRPRDSPMSPKEGYVSAAPGSGWTSSIYTVSPGIPGDSGSGVLTAEGEALGVMVTVSATGSNGVSTLSRMVDYARMHGLDVRLATWEQLDDGLLPPT